MLKYPMVFQVKSAAKPGINVKWQTSAFSMEQVLPAAVPPEFSGPGGGFSPEDFYALSIVNCYVATFKVYAEKSELQYEEITAMVTLEVDRDEKGFPWMARCRLEVKLYKPSSKEKAEAVLTKAYKGCLVMNSIRTEKTVDYQIIN